MATASKSGAVLRIHSQAGKETDARAAEDYDRLAAEARKPPSIVARVTSQERFRSNDQFGDLSGPALTVILRNADKGDVAQWAELAEFAISTDETLQSLYTSRITRVAQAEYEIVPESDTKPEEARLAAAAADFVRQQMARIENWDTAFPLILHAIAIAYSASEMEWQYDARTGVYFVVRIKERHPRRFRYGEQWDLRLYDRGMRPGADGSGELLRPELWIVHEHREVMGYQGVGGVMRSCALSWLLKRWALKFWIQHVEKYASPLVYGRVAKDTPAAARTTMLDGLQNLSADHVAVIEEGGEIVVVPTTQSSGSSDQHEKFIARMDAGLAKAWLGSSDSIESGPNGARSATETRMGATADPRMVADGKRVCATLRGSLIKQLIAFNADHICAMAGVPAVDASCIPLPVMRLKTADDEVKVDVGAARADAAAAQSSGVPSAPPAPPSDAPIDVAAIIREKTGGSAPEATAPAQPSAPTAGGAPPATQASPDASVQQQALNGAQVTSLLELLGLVAKGELPRDSAIELIVSAFPVDRAQAERILGSIGQGFVPKAEPAAAPPQPPEAAQFSEPARRRVRRPKATAAGEPRQQTIPGCSSHGSAPTHTPTPSISLETRIAKLLRD